VTEQEFESLLARGYETNDVEFKSRGNRRDPVFLAGIIRAVLGMANCRDGGRVIIGVESDTLDPVGFDEDEVEPWLNYDELAEKVNKFASPRVHFDVEAQAFRGRSFVIIRVHEFEDIPILCSRDFHGPGKGKGAPILRRGACYVRSRHKPETSEIPTEEEMRELLELAIDKGVRKFVTRAQKAGLFPTIPDTPAPPSDEASFEKQIEEME
jgi:predicted HTH transcriptional regulator